MITDGNDDEDEWLCHRKFEAWQWAVLQTRFVIIGLCKCMDRFWLVNGVFGADEKDLDARSVVQGNNTFS